MRKLRSAVITAIIFAVLLLADSHTGPLGVIADVSGCIAIGTIAVYIAVVLRKEKRKHA